MVRIKFKVVDVVGEVLNEEGVMGVVRTTYRQFVRKLLVLARKGKVSVKVKITSMEHYAALKQRLERHECICYTHTSYKGYAVCWKICKSLEELIRFYSEIYGLERKALEKIVERLNEAGRVVLV
mgnify:CR=1 FL=1